MALHLDPPLDVAELARQICDIRSVSGDEAALADAVWQALAGADHLRLDRDGDAIVARTDTGRPQRVIIAGHLDTVPIADNLPAQWREGPEGPVLWGRGSVDMKAALAIQLALAKQLSRPRCDLTWIWYDHEEVEATKSGLGRLVRDHPEWITGDFAILGEPTAGGIEGGCNGTIRVHLTTRGKAAHSARAWAGANAIHAAAPILTTLASYTPQTVTVDGLDYREGLSAVAINAGIAGNVIPDRCRVTINYRFAPDKTIEEALDHIRTLFAGYDCEVDDAASAARPGLSDPIAQDFVAAARRHGQVSLGPKYGWTDVARFAELGIPAINYGPGDPLLAHQDDEQCPAWQINRCYRVLADWLTLDSVA